MKQSVQKTIGILLVLLLIICTSKLVMAAETKTAAASDEKQPSLTITLRYTGTDKKEHTLPGVTLEILRVGSVTISNGAAQYQLTSDFSDLGISFSGMTASSSVKIAKALYESAQTKHINGSSKVTGSAGSAVFSNLQTGMYLVSAGASNNSQFDQMDPYLVTVPFLMKEGNAESWTYEVTSYPKFSTKGIRNPETDYHQETSSTETETKPSNGGNTSSGGTSHSGGGTTSGSSGSSSSLNGPKTGDDTPLTRYMMLLMISAGAVILIVVCRKRRNK